MALRRNESERGKSGDDGREDLSRHDEKKVDVEVVATKASDQ